jgi:hypothetical protein
MYGELASEVIHCPNCSEDVPKTLYCLNCGYPLYKIEQEQKASDERAQEIEVPDTSAVDTDVDMSVEIEPSPEVEIGTIEDELETTIDVDEPEEMETELEEIREEIVVEPEMEYSVDFEEPLEKGEEIIEEDVEEVTESIVTEPILEEETKEEPPTEAPEPSTYETPSTIPVTRESVTPDYEGEEPIMEETSIEFAPDPLTKEVMENLAKNITLKIRLVRLLKDGQVKEETFKKLFDSYVEQGRIWISRRDETLKRFKADIQRMEENLVNARKDYELLEIRKSIGDADEKEYEVKAPAYKWDIEHLDKEIQNRKAGIAYVSNLKNLVPDEEVDELKEMSSTDYSQIDEIEEVTEEARSRIKESLAEAYNSITTPTSNIF